MAKLLTIKRKDNGEIAIREHAIPGYTPEELNEMTLESLTVALVGCIAKQSEGLLDGLAMLMKTYEKADGLMHSAFHNRLSDDDIDKLAEVIFSDEGD